MNADTPTSPLEIPDVLAAVATSERTMFPHLLFPFTPGREKTVAAVSRALENNPAIFLMIGRRGGTPGDPGAQEICPVGTVVAARPVMKVAGGKTQVVVQGLVRARILEIVQTEPFLQVRIQTIEEPATEGTAEERALVRVVREDLHAWSSIDRKRLPPQVLAIAEGLESPGRLADLVASNLDLEPSAAQDILEALEPVERLRKAAHLLSDRLQYLKIRTDLETRVQEDMGRSRQDYFLRQQLKCIQEQLGEEERGIEQELDRYLCLAKEKSLPGPVRSELERCVQRLRWTSPGDAESSSLRSYLDCLTSLPWNDGSLAAADIHRAEGILNEHSWGLETVKERILEFLAVQALRPGSRGAILCFLGPPGVGKTSLCRSIALALGRPFVRISLGGLRDEAQIRGHRRAYVGAMPGVLIQAMLRAGTTDPVIVLDEIDKMAGDAFRDPSAALLEALDPEQNSEFQDHYLGVPYNLSRVLFLATANSANTISATLLDRLEVISLPGYTEEEKVRIARHSLMRRSLESSGLSERDLHINDAAVRRIVRGYTQEAGVRELERQLGKVARKVAVWRARGGRGQASVSASAVAEYLGPARRSGPELLKEDRIGVATGLVWTPFGGDLMLIEALAVPGNGKLQLTGQLGNVMKESAHTALSVARDFAERAGFEPRFFFDRDLHIHLPAGSIPKEGASSGVTLAAALISLLTGRPVRRHVAMTGEISLHGKILPVAGIREKILAARAAGIKVVVVPEHNRPDVECVPANLRGDLRFHYVSEVREVLDVAMAPERKGRRKREGAETGEAAVRTAC
jgi:ATP-dependent Lon protease